jgi:hypothetical protein
MKTLVIVIHPDINSSIVNKQWLEALSSFPENSLFINSTKRILTKNWTFPLNRN